MANGDRRLLLIPGFGGGRWTDPWFWNDVQETFDGSPISPDVGKKNTVQERAGKVIEAIIKEDPNNRYVIATYSGGGFVVRYLLSKLRADHPDQYKQISKVVVQDGAVLGGTIPLAYLYMYIFQMNGAKPIETLGVENDPDFEVLHLPITKQILFNWPHWTAPDPATKTVDQSIDMWPHDDRIRLISEIKKYDDDAGEVWGSGITKIAFSHGGTETFSHDCKEKLVNADSHPLCDLFHFRLFSTGGVGGDMQAPASSKAPIVEYKGHGHTLGDTKIVNVRLYFDGRYKIQWDLCPGSHGELSNQGPFIMEKLEADDAEGQLGHKCHQKVNSFIPTMSSLGITDDPERWIMNPNWIVGKTEDEIRNASGFDRVFHQTQNAGHSDDLYHDEIIVELRKDD